MAKPLKSIKFPGIDEEYEVLPVSGGTMTGNLAMSGKKITGLGIPSDASDAVTKGYADTKLAKSGGEMTGPVNMAGNKITGLAVPTEFSDAATKAYADKISNPKNLLDNSDFRTPVNQLGKTQYRSETKTIDRWYNGGKSCLLDIRDGYISMSNNENSTSSASQTLRQELIDPQKYIGKTLTFAAKVRGMQVRILTEGISGTSGSFADFPDWTIIIRNIYVPVGTTFIVPTIQCPKGNYWDCQWAALYEGSFTLETLPEFKPRSFAEEMAVCKQFDPITGKYIHTEVIQFGTLPASGQSEFKVGLENDVVDKVLALNITAYDTVDTQYSYNFPFLDTSGSVWGAVRKTGNRTFNIYAIKDMSRFTGTIYIRYTKN